MKIGVISDTHGDQAAVRQAVQVLADANMWLHAGDCSQDAEYLATLVKVPVIAARGNCDGHVAAKIDEFVDVAGKKIWLTHGHRYGVKYGTGQLAQWAEEYGMDVVIYGHTHVPDNRWHKGILFFNPGSAYGSCGTCGVLEWNEAGQVVGRTRVLQD